MRGATATATEAARPTEAPLSRPSAPKARDPGGWMASAGGGEAEEGGEALLVPLF